MSRLLASLLVIGVGTATGGCSKSDTGSARPNTGGSKSDTGSARPNDGGSTSANEEDVALAKLKQAVNSLQQVKVEGKPRYLNISYDMSKTNSIVTKYTAIIECVEVDTHPRHYKLMLDYQDKKLVLKNRLLLLSQGWEDYWTMFDEGERSLQRKHLGLE